MGDMAALKKLFKQFDTDKICKDDVHVFGFQVSKVRAYFHWLEKISQAQKCFDSHYSYIASAANL